ncbi:MAG: VWA domain-containing protein [Acidobacteriota bacterium]|nr:VWA domain-containing protein [Acidobacteriota bacterium]
MKSQTLAFALAAVAAASTLSAQQKPQEPGFTFRTTSELINVTVTVTDQNGRFVSGLRKDDFVVYEDGKPQALTHFDSERVPVSLGLVMDTSGSMAGEKMSAAKSAVERFLIGLLDQNDEIFLYQFETQATLVQDWTTDRGAVRRALGRIQARGGTAMYDAAAEAVPLAQSGKQRKKAVVIISDGNDTNSQIDIPSVQQLIRETEVLVYAIGIDGGGGSSQPQRQQPAWKPPLGIPIPSPFPGRRPPVMQPRQPQPRAPQRASRSIDGVDESALRNITDDSGGRTEIIRNARDLDAATAGIADELSKQYFLGYTSGVSKDGRWHSIEVRLKRGTHQIRARKGYVAS